MTTEVRKMKHDAYNREECVIVPPVDIYENENEYVLKADMPGVEKENLEVSLNNNELTVNGTVDGTDANGVEPKYREFLLHNFHRAFQVSEAVNANAIRANLDNGVLTITLPKSEAVKPKKIQITVEH